MTLSFLKMYFLFTLWTDYILPVGCSKRSGFIITLFVFFGIPYKFSTVSALDNVLTVFIYNFTHLQVVFQCSTLDC